ncbi:MAG: type III PLP-dependent enzyme [Alphaproteobacteria bacterium]
MPPDLLERPLPKSEAGQPEPLARRLLAAHFEGNSGVLTISGHSVEHLVDTYGSPLFVYDAGVMRASYRALAKAVSGFAEIYYSLKANPNPAVARIFVEEGAGLEIASAAEYERARAAGAPMGRIVFAGPGKTDAELAHVINRGIGEIHLESEGEIARLGALARSKGLVVPVAIRVNPVQSAQGGAMRMGGKPSPFGFDEEILDVIVDRVVAEPGLVLTGVHMFAGTQVLDAAVLARQWAHGIEVARCVAARLGRPLKTLDLGGGLGIPMFATDHALDLEAVGAAARKLAADIAGDPLLAGTTLLVEPGRFLVGESGVYLVRVTEVKTSRGERFVIADGGMHHHLAASGNLGQVIKRDFPVLAATRLNAPSEGQAALVGPLCTPLDTLARAMDVPALVPGDIIAVLQSGAYGLSASPVGFLSHPMPAEVLVDGPVVTEIRPRGTFEQPLTPLP